MILNRVITNIPNTLNTFSGQKINPPEARQAVGGDGMEVKLKPCPFCGGEAELNSTESIASVRCRFCGAATKLFIRYPIEERNHVEMAVNRWNKRWSDERSD